MDLFTSTDEFSEESFNDVDAIAQTVSDRQFFDCVFIGCQFAGAIIERCRFVDCTFQGCDLSNVNVRSSTFHDVKFHESKLLGVNWTAANSVSFLNFERSILNYSNFVGLDLRKSNIINCIAKDVDLAHANLTEVNCQGTDFTGSRFANTNLTKADFRRSLNYSIRPNENNIKKAIFSLPEASLLLYGLDIVLDESM